MFKYYNPQHIKKHRSYSVEQICAIFQKKKLHPQTVREWVKAGKLEVISKNPILIYGEVLKEFLITRNSTHKKQLEFNQFKCVRCQKIILPANNTVSLYPNINGSIKAVANCPSLNHEAIRYYKARERKKLLEVFVVQEVEVTSLCDQLDSAYKTNQKNTNNNNQSESCSNPQALPDSNFFKTN